ncbi:MAG TPA: glycosyltransferase [Longimicrobiaceae bacterium]|nr:glycosyltransferase [Longimicrobiaceae bacterium]
MICILHGYLLEGSGSNLWTRAIVESLCRQGETVHLMAQENHPERYPFVTQARRYGTDGSVETFYRGERSAAGCCILHKPVLGDTLPVYVWDRYEEFPRVVPMVELTDPEIEEYLDRNVRALLRVVAENGVTALHANHGVLMSVVAQRVSEATGIPFAVMPHGSALEFAIRRDPRFHRLATEAFAAAGRVFVHGEEMRGRVRSILPDVPGLEEKFSDLHLGVDTARFEPVTRNGRRASIERMGETLEGVPRGRTPAQTEAMLSRLHGGMDADELRGAFRAAQDYDNKAPDADVEAKLQAVRWESDPTLLFVGRLISTKGIHGVLAALPLLLDRCPDLRLLVVGHGPLREPLEALLWALEHGERALVERIVAEGRSLEGAPEGEGGGTELTQAARFLDALRARGELDAYYAAARERVRPDRVVFTGYLTHRELRYLFPCCDAAVFPSVVKEAGPLVFLEALASGAFPLGTYFGGMRASIDSVAEALPPGGAEAMKLSPDPEHTVADIVRHVPAALEMGERHKEALRRVARERYDWTSVARKLAAELEAL